MLNKLMIYVSNNLAYIGSLFYNHVQYTFFAILLAICIGIPVGIWIFNAKHMDRPVLGLANLIQAIPSLAILGFIVPYFGIGASTGIFMVVIYSLLPILKNTYTGLSNINPDTLEAAKGIGMTNWQILTKVQIPLALPVIMAGIRISSVTAVGLMTIAAYIGADVLGTLVISGMMTDNSAMILAGAIPACVLALTMDFVMSKVEKAVTPVSLQLTATTLTPKAVADVKKNQKRTAVAITALFAVLVGVMVYTESQKSIDIVVGSKEAVEGRVVGHIIAGAIEAQTDLNVERRMGLGGTMIAYEALASGEIDLYPEYTGTLLSTVLMDHYTSGTDSEVIYEQIKDNVFTLDGLYALDHYEVNNTYVLAVSQELAAQYNLVTMSDLAKVASRLSIGCTPEFATREDGLVGVQAAYDTTFGSTMNFSGTLMYTAIDSGEVDVITAFSTDSLLAKYDLVVLEDDLNFFPPYDLFPLASDRLWNTYPEVVEILNEIAPMLDDATMRRLNGYVVEDGMDYEQVADIFLEEIGVIG